MRFEPPEFSGADNDTKEEIPLFRVVISHHPVMLYLFFCIVFFCAYRLAEPLLKGDPLSIVIRFFMVGWAYYLLLFCLSALIFLYSGIEVTDQRIHGHMFSLRDRHFSVPLTDISSVRVSQYFFAGPLHYGRITLRIPKRRLYILYVREPHKVKRALDREIAKVRPPVK